MTQKAPALPGPRPERKPLIGLQKPRPSGSPAIQLQERLPAKGPQTTYTVFASGAPCCARSIAAETAIDHLMLSHASVTKISVTHSTTSDTRLFAAIRPGCAMDRALPFYSVVCARREAVSGCRHACGPLMGRVRQAYPVPILRRSNRPGTAHYGHSARSAPESQNPGVKGMPL